MDFILVPQRKLYYNLSPKNKYLLSRKPSSGIREDLGYSGIREKKAVFLSGFPQPVPEKNTSPIVAI
jgi:hypothetical protein